MKIGSQAHKELFCQSFIESHLVYEPEKLPWPQLDELALERLRSIPFWEEAFTLEQNAGVMVNARAQKVSDPLIREAIALQGIEEARHARLIKFMLNHYGIDIPKKPFPQPPEKLDQAFLDFGYSECLDSFLAFGLFKIARLSGVFPEPLFTIFDPILDEEARHIVFFVNWVAYEQIQQGRGANLFRAAHSLWYYSRALQHLIKMVTKVDNKGEGFTATGASAFMDDLTPQIFLSACLEENTRRMSHFDEVNAASPVVPGGNHATSSSTGTAKTGVASQDHTGLSFRVGKTTVDNRLLQPQFLPFIAQVALKIFRLLPQRSPHSEAKISLSTLKKL